MNCSIHITRSAKADLNSAADHIEYALLDPQAADALIDETENVIASLSAFPERFPLADDDLLRSWGVRFVRIKNYLAFYSVSESEGTVYFLRFLCSRRNWITILKSGISKD